MKLVGAAIDIRGGEGRVQHGMPILAIGDVFLRPPDFSWRPGDFSAWAKVELDEVRVNFDPPIDVSDSSQSVIVSLGESFHTKHCRSRIENAITVELDGFALETDSGAPGFKFFMLKKNQLLAFLEGMKSELDSDLARAIADRNAFAAHALIEACANSGAFTREDVIVRWFVADELVFGGRRLASLQKRVERLELRGEIDSYLAIVNGLSAPKIDRHPAIEEIRERLLVQQKIRAMQIETRFSNAINSNDSGTIMNEDEPVGYRRKAMPIVGGKRSTPGAGVYVASLKNVIEKIGELSSPRRDLQTIRRYSQADEHRSNINDPLPSDDEFSFPASKFRKALV